MSGDYCSSCGQRQLDLDQPFRDIAREAMDSFLAFDARILQTLWPLIRRPGLLTIEFMGGRRVRYVHPFKLYFIFSLLLFVVLAFSDYSMVRIAETGDVENAVQFELSERETEDSVAEESEKPSLLTGVLMPLAEVAEDDPKRLDRLFTDRLAKSIIVLVPVFALLLYLLYRGRRYLAHLVFSLHLHSFAFLALVVGLAVDIGIGAPKDVRPGNGVAAVVIAAYTFLALRRVYGQGRSITTLKMVVLLTGYIVALIATMALTLGLTAVTI
ncbi:MAG: DUF3667 domain-containing protein [Acidobacteriota bacterium]